MRLRGEAEAIAIASVSARELDLAIAIALHAWPQATCSDRKRLKLFFSIYYSE